jgi:acetyl esterase/lipase
MSLRTKILWSLAGVVVIGAVVVLLHSPSLSHLHSPLASLHGQPVSDTDAAAIKSAHAGVAALGKQWDATVLAETAQLYAPLHQHHDNTGIRRIAEVSYGADAQQTLDLFVPDQGFDELGPVLIYLHDDVSASGNKNLNGNDELFYSNTARLIARFGGVGINANYRLAPAATWPTGADDVRLLIAWARDNVAQYGGDPNSILVLGNGEGALHIATYLFNQAAQLDGAPSIAGAILGSGTFQPAADSALLQQYFGVNNTAHLPINLVDSYQGQAVPLFLWSAEYDPVQSGVTELKDKLCQKYGSCPQYVHFAEHNHISAIMSLDSSDMAVTNQLIRFYHSAVRK